MCIPSQDMVVKQNLIRTIDLIGRALHPDHLKKTDFIFSKRGDFINHLLVRHLSYRFVFPVGYLLVPVFCWSQSYVQAEPVSVPITSETRTLAISALATLTYPVYHLHVHPIISLVLDRVDILSAIWWINQFPIALITCFLKWITSWYVIIFQQLVDPHIHIHIHIHIYCMLKLQCFRIHFPCTLDLHVITHVVCTYSHTYVLPLDS